MRQLVMLSLILAGLVSPALAQRNIGGVDLTVDSKTVRVRVSVSGGSADLANLATRAFDSHGRYQLVASGFAFDIKFVAVGSNQVRADILNAAGAATGSETFSGPTAYAALLRAADFAVERTNGLGLKGFFSSRLALVGESTGKKEIYTAGLFFTPGSVRKETDDRAQVLTPRWSPDGKQIVYTSYLKGVPDIFLIDLAAQRRDVLVSVQGTNMAGPFSPDGRKVLTVLTGPGRPEVYIVDVATRRPERRTNSDAVKSSPVWSPDGSQILFAMAPGPQLYLMSTAPGGVPRRIPTESSLANEPSWSRANPNKVAFTLQEGRTNRIGVVDLSTGRSERVSPAQFYGMQPSWLPDGRHLVYTVQTQNGSRLHILDTESGKSTAISVRQVEPASQASVWAP